MKTILKMKMMMQMKKTEKRRKKKMMNMMMKTVEVRSGGKKMRILMILSRDLMSTQILISCSTFSPASSSHSLLMTMMVLTLITQTSTCKLSTKQIILKKKI